jgi:UDPglucose 6-dehydrogenase
MSNIVIAGYGFVGKAHDEVLKNYFSTSIVDPKFNSNRVYDYPNADGVIIAVATPKGLDNSCDMQNVIKVIRDTRISTPILIKSTISLEGWYNIKRLYPTHTIAFSPEFLRAASAIEDFANTGNLYIGGDATDFWKNIFVTAFRGLIDIQTQFSPEELILNKYFENSFLATKVAFFNQIYDLCKAANINYDNVSYLVGSDYRIGHSHTVVTNDRGFGGHCFPKDTSAILHTADSLGVNLSILREAVSYNKTIRTVDDL